MTWQFEHLSYRRLQLPVPGFRTARGELDGRSVVVVRVRLSSEAGTTVGWGEAAPLDGWGSASIETIEAALTEVALPDDIPPIEHLDDRRLAHISPPAARAALETAVLDAVARSRDLPLAALVGGSNHAVASVPVNATVGADASLDDLPERFDVRCLKLKVGDRSWKAACRRIETWREALPETTTLRVDANGQWSPDRARRALERLAGLAIDYVEQPVARDRRDTLVELARESPVDVAADESAHPLERAEDLLGSEIPVLVLKPALLGGPLVAHRLAERAAETGTRITWTSAIGSAIERTAVGHLAAACLSDPSTRESCRGPHGLATGALLADDVATLPGTNDGLWHRPDGPGLGFDPDRAALERLSSRDATRRGRG